MNATSPSYAEKAMEGEYSKVHCPKIIEKSAGANRKLQGRILEQENHVNNLGN